MEDHIIFERYVGHVLSQCLFVRFTGLTLFTFTCNMPTNQICLKIIPWRRVVNYFI